jgi:hypothetical protein
VIARADQSADAVERLLAAQLQGGFPFQYGGLVRGHSNPGRGGLFSGAIQKPQFNAFKAKIELCNNNTVAR